MTRWRNRIRHAFAVDPPGPVSPTAEQAVLIDDLARMLARRRMTTPACVMLEMGRPLNFIGSQMMQALSPMMWAVLHRRGYASYKEMSSFLEHRGSIEHILRRVEHFEAEFERETSTSSTHDTEGV